MICFKDRTFCSASSGRGHNKCMNETCYRFLTEAECKRAEELELPIAYSNFWDNCNERIENDN
jgi:hypothetical protein